MYAVKRRSAKSALDSVERAPVGPVVADCRHAVLAASFIKMGSMRHTLHIGSTQGEGGRVKKEGRK
jgi:hypothetical protein